MRLWGVSTGLIGNAGPSLTGCQNSRGGPKSRMGWLRNPGDWLKCVKVDAMGFRSIRYRTGPRNVRRTDISWLSRRAVCAALRVCDSRRGRVCGGDIQDIGISTFTSCWRNRRHQGSRLRAMTKNRKKKANPEPCEEDRFRPFQARPRSDPMSRRTGGLSM